jgi:prepilin-type processing-associated H-X9-DG protein
MGEIRDGTANTIMIVEVRDPVPWTQPDTDLHFDSMSFQINGGPESIGSFHPKGAMVGFADGSVQYLHDDVDPQTLRFLIQPADGNFIQPNFQ